MSWKKWLLVIPLLLILVGLGIWTGWTLMSAAGTTESGDNGRPAATQAEGELSGEVVNTPVADDAVVFKNADIPFKNSHDFISKTHTFYNETLGWGRIERASYEEQKKRAESILQVIDHIQEVKMEELQKDFDQIKALAETVTIKDDRKAIRDLHRYFHDLDIYFNGYDYHETFQVTSFKGMQ